MKRKEKDMIETVEGIYRELAAMVDHYEEAKVDELLDKLRRLKEEVTCETEDRRY